MLPNFSKLSIKPTGEFYALSQSESDALLAAEARDPITLEDFSANEDRSSDRATFRVRVRDSNGNWIYNYYIARSLWEWVRRPNNDNPPTAKLPDTNEPIWREDWWDLHDRYAQFQPWPHWVQNLPLFDTSIEDTHDYAPPPAPGVFPGFFTLENDDDLVGDLAIFNRDVEIYNANRTLANANHVSNAISTIRTGIRNYGYVAELGLSHMLEAFQEFVRVVFSLFRVATDTANVRLKGNLLRLMADIAPHSARFRSWLRWQPSLQDLIIDYNSAATQVTASTNLSHIDGGLTTWWAGIDVSARIVLHHFLWDKRIPSWWTRTETFNVDRRPSSAPNRLQREQRILRLSMQMTGVVHYIDALTTYGVQQFFVRYGQPDTEEPVGDYEKVINLLQKMVEELTFLNTFSFHGFRHLDGRVQTLTVDLYKVVIKAVILMTTTSETGFLLARFRLMVEQMLTTLTVAVTVSMPDAAVPPENTASADNMEQFFWKYVAHTYNFTERTESGATAVEKAVVEFMIPEFEASNDNGDDTDEEEEEDEEEPPVAPPTTPTVPRYNLRPRPGRSGETPDSRRQRTDA